jgi:uncharacterized protein YndB with AHSA1/START domain
MTDETQGAGADVPDGGHSVEAERAISAPPERIWQALADPERLAGWFVDGARREGDRYFWRWEDFGQFDVRVLEEEPGERLVMEGPGMHGTPHRTEVRIRREGGDTVVHIVESGFFGHAEEDDEARGVRSGWMMALALLDLYVTEYWDERRHAFFTLRPAAVEWAGMLAWFTEPHLLEQWLGKAQAPLRVGGPVDIGVRGGPPVSGRVLAVTDTEVSLAWAEGHGALELKAFAGPEAQRFVALRGTHWGQARDFRGLEDAAEAALDRLVGLLAP